MNTIFFVELAAWIESFVLSQLFFMGHLSLTKQSTEIRWNNPKESFVCKNFFSCPWNVFYCQPKRGLENFFVVIIIMIWKKFILIIRSCFIGERTLDRIPHRRNTSSKVLMVTNCSQPQVMSETWKRKGLKERTQGWLGLF